MLLKILNVEYLILKYFYYGISNIDFFDINIEYLMMHYFLEKICGNLKGYYNDMEILIWNGEYISNILL